MSSRIEKIMVLIKKQEEKRHEDSSTVLPKTGELETCDTESDGGDFSNNNSDADMTFNPETEDYQSSEDEDVEIHKIISAPGPSLIRRGKIDPTNGKTAVSQRKQGVFSRKKRAERKRNRNHGESYITAKGKEVKRRTSVPLGMCRMKCKDKMEVKLNEEKTVREQIFEEYWSLGDRNKRVNFVVGLVDTQSPATSRKRTTDPEKQKHRSKTHIFHFKINGKRVRVCRACFMKTLNETQMFITTALANRDLNVSGITSDDKRGRLPPKNKHSLEKIQEVRDHISSFPLYNSHYTRRESSRRYLPPHLSLRIMYDLYCENKNSKEKRVSRQIYEREFHGMNLSFKEPKVDTCHKCDLLQTKLKVTNDDKEKQNIELEISTHHAEADNTYLAKKKDKQMAAEDETLRCYTFDLQQCLPTPMLNTSVAFYKRQLWTFNLTMHETSRGDVRCYMWHEAEGGRGGNQIATCIYKELTRLPPQVTKVTLYSDTCGGQNKNSHVSAMFLVVMQQNKNLQTVDHKFMVSGHSHLECDVDHGLIEKQKKKLQVPISHPHDWYQLVRTVGKKKKFEVEELSHCDFLDFADLLKTSLLLRKKDDEGNPFNWHAVKWFRYTQDKGIVYFKTNISEGAPFGSLDLNRRGHLGEELKPKKCYNTTLSISKEKKKDILDLLPLIAPTFHDFYKNLKTNESPDAYPDEDFEEEGE